MAEKRYTVANPKHIDAGIRIFAYRDQDYFEGDVFMSPTGMKRAELARWVDGGYLVATTEGDIDG